MSANRNPDRNPETKLLAAIASPSPNQAILWQGGECLGACRVIDSLSVERLPGEARGPGQGGRGCGRGAGKGRGRRRRALLGHGPGLGAIVRVRRSGVGEGYGWG